MNALTRWACAVLLALPLCASGAAPRLPAELEHIGIDQHLDAPLPLDTPFTDEAGRPVTLGAFFGRRPVIFVPVYYTCPMLCNQILAGVVAGLRPLSLKPGRDFDVVAMSINPRDTPQQAAAKRDQFVHSYSTKRDTTGWHFLTGSQASIDRVTRSIGFRYRWDQQHQMFVHASGIMIATAGGKLSRYFYGVEFEPKDLKLGLIEASGNRIGTPADQILLFCYHYDPRTGKYGAAVLNLLRLSAALLVIALAAGLFLLWRRDLRAERAHL